MEKEPHDELGHQSVQRTAWDADVTSPETLQQVRDFKKAKKMAAKSAR